MDASIAEKQPPLTIRHATLSDAHLLASLTLQGFRSAPFWEWLHPIPPSASLEYRDQVQVEVYRNQVASMKRLLCNSAIRAYVALYNGQPAGFSMWSVQSGTEQQHSLSHRLRHITLYEKMLRAWYRVVDLFCSYIPARVQTTIWFPTLGPQYLARRRLIMQQQEEAGPRYIAKEDKERGFKMLYYLTVLPEYERKGIGSKLLRKGCEEAQEDDVPVYLGATPAGKPLYEWNGFQVLGLETKGELGVCTWTEALMKWMPHSPSV